MNDIFSDLDLLDITAATALLRPGQQLPKPFLDLSKAKPKKGRLSLASNHYYWLRGQLTGKGSPKRKLQNA